MLHSILRALWCTPLLLEALCQSTTILPETTASTADSTTVEFSSINPIASTERSTFPDAETTTESVGDLIREVEGIQPRVFAAGEHRKNFRLSEVPVTRVVQGLVGLPPYYCLALCLREKENCEAFNFHRAEGICELLSMHVCNQSGLRLTQTEGFAYFDVYQTPGAEITGGMHGSLYCEMRGLCRPECETWARMPFLNEPCAEDFECTIRTGDRAVCRTPPGLCKCQDGFYIDRPRDRASSCSELDAEGFRIFPNLKSKTKDGLYFKLVHQNMNFEQASNHCIEAEGGFLAIAEDGETNRFLRQYMRKFKVRSAYLGLSDQAQEGNWLWTHTGQKLKTSQFWKSGAPDNFNDIEHCATITNEIDFGWDDVPCEKATKFFCQRSEVN